MLGAVEQSLSWCALAPACLGARHAGWGLSWHAMSTPARLTDCLPLAAVQASKRSRPRSHITSTPAPAPRLKTHADGWVSRAPDTTLGLHWSGRGQLCQAGGRDPVPASVCMRHRPADRHRGGASETLALHRALLQQRPHATSAFPPAPTQANGTAGKHVHGAAESTVQDDQEVQLLRGRGAGKSGLGTACHAICDSRRPLPVCSQGRRLRKRAGHKQPPAELGNEGHSTAPPEASQQRMQDVHGEIKTT